MLRCSSTPLGALLGWWVIDNLFELTKIERVHGQSVMDSAYALRASSTGVMMVCQTVILVIALRRHCLQAWLAQFLLSILRSALMMPWLAQQRLLTPQHR